MLTHLRTGQQKSILHRLPSELRLHIYSYLRDVQQHHTTFLYDGSTVCRLTDAPFINALALSRTCRLLHAELDDALYENTVFTIQIQNYTPATTLDSRLLPSDMLSHRPQSLFLQRCRDVRLEISLQASSGRLNAGLALRNLEMVLMMLRESRPLRSFNLASVSLLDVEPAIKSSVIAEFQCLRAKVANAKVEGCNLGKDEMLRHGWRMLWKMTQVL